MAALCCVKLLFGVGSVNAVHRHFAGEHCHITVSGAHHQPPGIVNLLCNALNMVGEHPAAKVDAGIAILLRNRRKPAARKLAK